MATKLKKEDVLEYLESASMLEVSEVCINLTLFKKAYNWANKAISTGKLLDKAYYQRAEVLVAVAEYNMSEEIDFCDRLVYDIAFSDYDLAYQNGNFNAKIFMNQIEELITTRGDWFLNADGKLKISPGSEDCKKLKQSSCYEWIKKEVKTKDK